MEVVVKLIIFSFWEGKLRVFLKEKLLPKGKILPQEKLDKTAFLILEKNLPFPLSEVYLEQLYTVFDQEKKELKVFYYALISQDKISQKQKENWVSVEGLEKNLEEFSSLQYALQRLRWKVEYTNVVYSLLPREFTFSQLQEVYEGILGRTLDKRNFRKKIFSLKIISPTGRRKKLGRARPALLYAFKKRKLTYVQIL